MKKLFLLSTYLLLLSGGVVSATAPQPQPQAQAEIMHLLEFVQQSACQFNRNNTWYNGKDARLHLKKKYDYLVKRGVIGKAEDFIEKAASQRSVSGRAYQIRCRDGKIISSAQWFTEELQQNRQHRMSK